ncbi:MAG: glycogen/starch synthase, partial [Eubacterium sp.]|nr:glycogen/starch synthase [Eubacterium sp.]
LVRRNFVKTVFTIHNVQYQGAMSGEAYDTILDLPVEERHVVAFGDHVNLMKGAVEVANAVTTVSPSYAEELKYPANAFGLDDVIRSNSYKLRGIINGIDMDVYDPSVDSMIEANYSAEDPAGKAACKAALQREVGLPERDVPLITMVTRLVAPKGLDLVRETMDGILANNDVQFILLGTGDMEYEDYFRGLEWRHPDKMRALITFNGALSHRLYAGGNILLVPSRSEPCGLTQMIGCRYADVPLVRRTGGLGDTIDDCTLGDGNGFVFDQFTPDAFYQAVMNAIGRFWERENWAKLEKFDMEQNFGWEYSADRYIELYKELEE